MRIVQLMTDRSRYFNPSKNYWFSFNAFLISLIGLYFRCLSFRVVLVNTVRPDGGFLFVVWFIHWKRMIRPFLFIDKQRRKLSIHQLVVDFWLANVTKLDDQNWCSFNISIIHNQIQIDESTRRRHLHDNKNHSTCILEFPGHIYNMLTLMLHETILII
jgi:hypothetical protein